MTNSKPPRYILTRKQLLAGLLGFVALGTVLGLILFSRGETEPDAEPPAATAPETPPPDPPGGGEFEPEPEPIECEPLWEANAPEPVVRQTQSGGDVTFAGYSWNVRDYDGGPTSVGTWAPEQVSVDGENLRLRLSEIDEGLWRSAEVYSTQQGFGYGTYRWRIETDLTALDPRMVLGLFTYERDAPGNREIDIEFTRWADATRHNAHVTRHQRDGLEGRSWQLNTPEATEHAFRWQEGQITWCSRNVFGTELFATQLDTDLTPGDERVHMNLWIYGGQAPEQPAEVVVSDFEFAPSG